MSKVPEEISVSEDVSVLSTCDRETFEEVVKKDDKTTASYLLTVNWSGEVYDKEPVLTTEQVEHMVNGVFLTETSPPIYVELLSAQMERGVEDKRLHCQMFIKTKIVNGQAARKKPSTLGNNINRKLKEAENILYGWICHVKRVGSRQTDAFNAFNYCKKLETRATDYPTRCEIGVVNLSRNDKRELKSQRSQSKRQTKEDEALTEKKMLLQKGRDYVNANEFPTWALYTEDLDTVAAVGGQGEFKKDFDNEIIRKRLKSVVNQRTIEDVTICFGFPGTGKSTWIKNEVKRITGMENLRSAAWYQDDDVYFGSSMDCYTNHPYIVVEEMNRGHEFNFASFKKFCDVGHNEAMPMRVKNGIAFSNHKGIYFSTNSHPLTWYAECENNEFNYQALRRRLAEARILYFPRYKSDGSSNVYDKYIHDETFETYSVDITHCMPANAAVLTATHFSNLIPAHLRADCKPGDRSYEVNKHAFDYHKAAWMQARGLEPDILDIVDGSVTTEIADLFDSEQILLDETVRQFEDTGVDGCIGLNYGG